jgi:hypothetical protein
MHDRAAKRRATSDNRGCLQCSNVLIRFWRPRPHAPTVMRCTEAVRIKAKANNWIAGLAPGSLFYAREGKFVLKYFCDGTRDTGCFEPRSTPDQRYNNGCLTQA